MKSAARWQSWTQAKPSPVSFGIARTRAWDAQTGTLTDERRRQADVCVFALLDVETKAELDPLELSQWRFFVLATSVLNAHCSEQERVSLGRLCTLGAQECSDDNLAELIEGVV